MHSVARCARNSGKIHCRGGWAQDKILPTRPRTAYSLSERTARPVRHSPEGVKAEAAGMLAVRLHGNSDLRVDQVPEPDAVGPGRLDLPVRAAGRPPADGRAQRRGG